MIRLFVGIAIPSKVKSRLLLLSSGLPGARWTRQESYHLTLNFIGSVDQGVAEDIDDMLSKIRVDSFDLQLSGIGYFGKASAPRALWVGIEQNVSLMSLQRKIARGLKKSGIINENRKFTPHITLARLRNTPSSRLENYIGEHSQFSITPFRVFEFTLFSSFLSSSGAIYLPEAVYEF